MTTTATKAMSFLRVKKLSDAAHMPVRGSPLSAGFDLASAETTVIKAGSKGIVKTDLSIACPPNTYARIAPRSGLAVKKFIDVGAGVVDADYRGPVGVVLFNFGSEDFQVQPGDRVAQLILEEISMVDTIEVDSLEETERGAGGFGSTGVATSTEVEPASKKRAISPTSELEDSVLQVQDFLSMMLDTNEICNSPKEFRYKLKKLALKQDAKLFAAFAVYQSNKSTEDFMDTLKVIVELEEKQ